MGDAAAVGHARGLADGQCIDAVADDAADGLQASCPRHQGGDQDGDEEGRLARERTEERWLHWASKNMEQNGKLEKKKDLPNTSK